MGKLADMLMKVSIVQSLKKNSLDLGGKKKKKNPSNRKVKTRKKEQTENLTRSESILP